MAELLVGFHRQRPPEVLPLSALKGLGKLPGVCCLRWTHFVIEAAEQKEASKEPSEPRHDGLKKRAAGSTSLLHCVPTYSHASSQSFSAAADWEKHRSEQFHFLEFIPSLLDLVFRTDTGGYIRKNEWMNEYWWLKCPITQIAIFRWYHQKIKIKYYRNTLLWLLVLLQCC